MLAAMSTVPLHLLAAGALDRQEASEPAVDCVQPCTAPQFTAPQLQTKPILTLYDVFVGQFVAAVLSRAAALRAVMAERESVPPGVLTSPVSTAIVLLTGSHTGQVMSASVSFWMVCCACGDLHVAASTRMVRALRTTGVGPACHDDSVRCGSFFEPIAMLSAKLLSIKKYAQGCWRAQQGNLEYSACKVVVGGVNLPTVSIHATALPVNTARCLQTLLRL